MPYTASFSCLWCQVKSSHKWRMTKSEGFAGRERPCASLSPSETKTGKNILSLTEKKTWSLLRTRDRWTIMLLCCITGPDLLYLVLEPQNLSFLSKWVRRADPCSCSPPIQQLAASLPKNMSYNFWWTCRSGTLYLAWPLSYLFPYPSSFKRHPCKCWQCSEMQ